MNNSILKKSAPFMALLLTSALLMQFVWRAAEPGKKGNGHPAEKVNLALRRTAHLLLKEAGDSTSRIPPVEQTGPNVWLVRLERPFSYDRLPTILHASFEAHGIADGYDVSVLRCTDGAVLLGYNFLDYLPNKNVPCGGRELSPDCRNLQVTFSAGAGRADGLPLMGWLFSGALVIVLYGFGGIWQRRRPEQQQRSLPETNWLHFGRSRLDVAGRQLFCGSARHQLTYREAKLLHLFAERPNQVLERGFILDNVWADEGILVGRSIDMFVSRLRKILRDDPSVQLVAVHGVGYRMEVG